MSKHLGPPVLQTWALCRVLQPASIATWVFSGVLKAQGLPRSEVTLGLGRPFQGCFVGGGICSNLHGNLITVQVAFALYQPPPWLCATAARLKGSPEGSANLLYCNPLGVIPVVVLVQTIVIASNQT